MGKGAKVQQTHGQRIRQGNARLRAHIKHIQTYMFSLCVLRLASFGSTIVWCSGGAVQCSAATYITYIHTYIHTYMCVCVCVCARARAQSDIQCLCFPFQSDIQCLCFTFQSDIQCLCFPFQSDIQCLCFPFQSDIQCLCFPLLSLSKRHSMPLLSLFCRFRPSCIVDHADLADKSLHSLCR